jgi:hypothetical protein
MHFSVIVLPVELGKVYVPAPIQYLSKVYLLIPD